MAKATDGSNIVVSMFLERTEWRKGLSAAGKEADEWGKRTVAQVTAVGKNVRQIGGALNSLAPILRAIGIEGGNSFRTIGGAASGLLSIVAGGGLAGVLSHGLIALGGAALNAVVSMREASRHMMALGDEAGITSGQVSNVAEAFSRVGLSVNRLDAQRITKLGVEAGLTTDEIGSLASRIKSLATLEGIDPTAAAKEVFDQFKSSAAETIRMLEDANAALRGESASKEKLATDEALEQLAAREGRLTATRESLLIHIQKAEGRLRAMAFREGDAYYRRAEEELRSLNARLRETSQALSLTTEETKKLQAEWSSLQAGKAAQEADKLTAAIRRRMEQAKREAEARAKARAAAVLETNVMVAVASRDEEAAAVARLTQALAQLEDRRRSGTISAADAERQAQALIRQNDEAIEAIARQMVHRHMDATLQLRQAEAQLTGDLIGQARARGDAALEQMQRRLEEEGAALERTRQRMAEVEEEYEAKIARSKGAARAKLEADRDAEVGRLQAHLDRQAAIHEATGQQIAVQKQATAQELERIDAEQALRSQDYDRQTALMAAQLSDDRIEQLRIRSEEELDEVKRLEDAKTITTEQAEQRRHQIRQRFQAEQAQVTEQQIGEAMQAGAGIGQSFIQGIKSSQEGDEWQTVLSSFIRVAAGIAALTGNPLLGMGLNLFAGAFADGGLVRGPGGPREDKVIAAVSPGEFVNQGESVKRFGVPFFAQLNRGILDLSALPGSIMPRFADGGLVGGGFQGVLAGAGGGGAGGEAAQMAPPVQNVTINAPGGFLHRELLRREIPGLLRELAIIQEGTFMRSVEGTRGLGRRG